MHFIIIFRIYLRSVREFSQSSPRLEKPLSQRQRNNKLSPLAGFAANIDTTVV